MTDQLASCENPIHFGPFSLHSECGPLLRDGEDVQLRAMAMKLLWHLANHPGIVISKNDLFAAVWPDRVVTDGCLNVSAKEIRDALGDSSRCPLYLQTVHRVGYRFIGRSVSTPRTNGEGFVGRLAQLNALSSALGNIEKTGCRMICVAANAGYGKTRLLETWLTQCREEAIVLRGGCYNECEALEAYAPVITALQNLLRRDPAYLNIMRELAPAWLAQFPSLLNQKDRDSILRAAANTDAGKMRREFTELITGLSERGPIVLLLDDMQWSDTATASLLSYLVRELQERPVLILFAYRDSAVQVHGHPIVKVIGDWKLSRRCEEFEIGPLALSEVEDHLRVHPDIHDYQAAARYVFKLSEGHPLFMTALANQVNEYGVPDNATSFPHDLVTFIELRMTELSERECCVLEAASLVGVTFWTGEIDFVIEGNAQLVTEVCETLAKRGEFLVEKGVIITSGGLVTAQYDFYHALYPEIIQRRLGAATRARLHGQIANSIRNCFASDLDAVATKLVFHYEQANDYANAAIYLRLAAGVASNRNAQVEAISLLNNALEITDRLPACEQTSALKLDLLLALGPAQIAQAGYGASEVENTFASARELCAHPGNADFQFPVLRGLAALYHIRADYQTAFALGEEILALPQEHVTGNSSINIEGNMILGLVQFYSGQFKNSVKSLGYTLNHYDASVHSGHADVHGIDPGALAAAFSAIVHYFLGNSAQSDSCVNRALQITRLVDHQFTIAQTHAILALLYQFRCDLDRVRQHSTQAMDLAHRYSFSFLIASETVRQAWLQVQSLKKPAAIDEIQRGIASYQETGAVSGLTVLKATLAEVCLILDDIELGLQTVDEAISFGNSKNETFYLAELHRLKCELLRRYGDSQSLSMAKVQFDKACQISLGQQSPVLQRSVKKNLLPL